VDWAVLFGVLVVGVYLGAGEDEMEVVGVEVGGGGGLVEEGLEAEVEDVEGEDLWAELAEGGHCGRLGEEG